MEINPRLIELPTDYTERFPRAVFFSRRLVESVTETTPVVILNRFGRPFGEVDGQEDLLLTELVIDAGVYFEIDDGIDPEVSLIDGYSIDGLDLSEYICELEKRLCLKFTDEELAEIVTLTDIRRLITRKIILDR